MDEARPFNIPKREVWEAFKKVKANQGAAGVDGQSITEFEPNITVAFFVFGEPIWRELGVPFAKATTRGCGWMGYGAGRA